LLKFGIKNTGKFAIMTFEWREHYMEKLVEIARAFYGVLVPRKVRKNFFRITIGFLDQRYPVETAIGLALRKLHLS